MARYLNRVTTVIIVLMAVLLFQKYSTTAMVLVGGYLLYRAFTGTNRRAIRTHKLLKRMERNLKSLHGIEMSLQELTQILRESKMQDSPSQLQYPPLPSSGYTPEFPVEMEH